MYKVTEDSCRAFWKARPFKRGNTRVEVDYSSQEVKMYLHGNKIATRPFSTSGELSLNDCGWKTVTTKRRLNEILRVVNMHIFQKNGEWYLQRFPHHKEEWGGIIKVGYNTCSN